MALKIGDKAPDFKLPSFTPSDDLVEFSLSSYLGKKNVLILFFPQAFTGGCTAEMCKIEETYDEIAGGETEVLGISVDGTFVQKAFAKQNNIKYPLLSDFNKEVIVKYDVVHEAFAHGMNILRSQRIRVCRLILIRSKKLSKVYNHKGTKKLI